MDFDSMNEQKLLLATNNEIDKILIEKRKTNKTLQDKMDDAKKVKDSKVVEDLIKEDY